MIILIIVIYLLIGTILGLINNRVIWDTIKSGEAKAIPSNKTMDFLLIVSVLMWPKILIACISRVVKNKTNKISKEEALDRYYDNIDEMNKAFKEW